MRSATILLADCEDPLCHRAWLARHAHQRLRGLLFRPPLQTGEGLLLSGIHSIHTFGMKYRLDVVFLDRDLAVTGFQTQVAPCRVLLSPGKSAHVLELPPGTIDRFSVNQGSRLVVQVHDFHQQR